MRHTIGYSMIPVLAGLLAFSQGCASDTGFPINGTPSVKSQSDFGVLMAKPDVYEGRAIKLAGRMVRVEATDKGTRVLAEWVPYPDIQYLGPLEPAPGKKFHFTLLYPGKIDPEGSLLGNKFLAVGKIEETKTKDRFRGSSPSGPYLVASCLHVWKTGDTEIEAAPDYENTGYPPKEQTYCVKT